MRALIGAVETFRSEEHLLVAPWPHPTPVPPRRWASLDDLSDEELDASTDYLCRAFGFTAVAAGEMAKLEVRTAK
jgi:hypothetical protein